jgi:hypothetical protein
LSDSWLGRDWWKNLFHFIDTVQGASDLIGVEVVYSNLVAEGKGETAVLQESEGVGKGIAVGGDMAAAELHVVHIKYERNTNS